LQPHIEWPNGKRFAFSIFDDPDGQQRSMMNAVYGLLGDLGIFTTKGVWPNAPHAQASDPGETCGSEEYVRILRQLQAAGFEIGYHNATSHTSDRAHTIVGLDRFRDLFGHDPVTMSNHFFCDEAIYFGDARLTGLNRKLYRLMRRSHMSLGHVPEQDLFWGDLCRDRVRYVRSFIFGDINTLRVCPLMPYHDPLRPFVNYWYCSTEAANLETANKTLVEAAQDRLEEEGGACILYTHFGHGFATEGQVNPRFRELITRLSEKKGWFAPVGTLLDFLRKQQGHKEIGRGERAALERRWLIHKARFGTA
jgi:hypothetical protein